ncbi:hypothetical protein B0I37DRAFT_360842 [Chaetomium sp. MPI-CAGE-AT-0009]|nr:hypothetical protein B0I37DRAFT_360842 [Chaetomium sp. MPI-CAGE-AT-0009]
MPSSPAEPELSERWVAPQIPGWWDMPDSGPRGFGGLHRMTREDVRIALLSGECTPDAGLVMLDFLYRHHHLGIWMSEEQKKAMKDALHPLGSMSLAPVSP